MKAPFILPVTAEGPDKWDCWSVVAGDYRQTILYDVPEAHPDEEAQAFAEFAVRAINNHNALFESLYQVEAHLNQCALPLEVEEAIRRALSAVDGKKRYPDFKEEKDE